MSGQQKFSAQPSELVVAPGSQARLQCFVENKAGECRWSLEGKPVGMFEGKYEMTGDREGGDCRLEPECGEACSPVNRSGGPHSGTDKGCAAIWNTVF